MHHPESAPLLGTQLADDLLAALETPVLLLDQDGAILRFNRASEELSGHKAADVAGRKIWDFLIVEEEIDQVQKQFRQSLDADGVVCQTHFWLTRDGGRRLMRCRYRRSQSTSGTAGSCLVMATDITAQRDTEQQLTESYSFLQSIIDASPVAIITIDERGAILSFSRQAEVTFGSKADAVIGKNVNMLMPEPDHSRHDEYLRHYMDTGDARIIGQARSVTARRLDGETFPAVLHVSEFLDGKHIFVGFVEDVTAQRAAERRLAETQAQLQHAGRLGAMGEMASTIAHELNQPLTAAASLLGAAQLTLEKNPDKRSAKAVDLLEESVAEIRRASDIIRQMRDFIRKRKTARSLHDISNVVEEASTVALIGAEAEGIGVSKDLQPGLPVALVDRVQIQQVVTNLVRNAMDAMADAPKRRLSIATAYRNGMVEITISDTGPGIDGDIMPRLFEPFATTKDNGTGIGLSISKSIIDAHQGTISAKNKNDGGCIFTVSLPAGNRNDRP